MPFPTNEISAPEPSRAERIAGWLIGPFLLSVTLATVFWIQRGPDRLFGLALGAVILVSVSWVLVSVFFPATPDRRCPECSRATLVRSNSDSTRGLLCASCGFEDESASSFLLAEEEGPLEGIVMKERAQRPRIG